MILRKYLLLVTLWVVPCLAFQPTLAHFPSPEIINRQFAHHQHREVVSTAISKPSSTALRASTAIPPPPLSGNRLVDPSSSSSSSHSNHHTQHQHHQGGVHLFQPKRRELLLEETDYQRRKDEWACKYTSVDALRRTFGASRNGIWGDLDAQTARRLYKTLLPRALLELHKMGVRPQDLAPLAYRARVAAKLYARERCILPYRIAANLYDGFRQWKRYGSFDTHGMSFQQIWDKYSNMILEESHQDLTGEDVTAKICLKILERSCATNEMVDNLVLRGKEGKEDLDHFTQTLEQDVRRLLQPVKEVVKPSEQELQRFRTLRRVARIKKRLNTPLQHRSQQPQQSQQQQQQPQATKMVQEDAEAREHSRGRFPWQNRAPRTTGHVDHVRH